MAKLMVHRQILKEFHRLPVKVQKRNLLTFEDAVHEARLAVESGNFTRYAHVLVDKAQDFSLEGLRLIRARKTRDRTKPACAWAP